jgi:hypothetical protein
MEADELTLTRELETALSPCVAVDSRVVADAVACALITAIATMQVSRHSLAET